MSASEAIRRLRAAPPIVRYSAAAAGPSIALVTSVAIDRYLGRPPTAPTLATILGVAWAVGFGPAALATALSIAVFDYFAVARLVDLRFLGRRDVIWILEAIEQNARLQATLVDELLDVSRIVAGKLTVHRRTTDLATVVRDAIEGFRPSADARGLRLDVLIVPAPCRILGDPDRLTQILSNLVANSLKFTPPGGRVEIDLTREAGMAQLAVRDTGVGIRAGAIVKSCGLSEIKRRPSCVSSATRSALHLRSPRRRGRAARAPRHRSAASVLRQPA
jgi:Histidine kinase-, DNA gyrase B-, and HSP90-like ATPase